MCQCRVIGFSDVIVCKFHIIFICGGVMRWIASEIYYRGQRESNWGSEPGEGEVIQKNLTLSNERIHPVRCIRQTIKKICVHIS